MTLYADESECIVLYYIVFCIVLRGMRRRQTDYASDRRMNNATVSQHLTFQRHVYLGVLTT